MVVDGAVGKKQTADVSFMGLYGASEPSLTRGCTNKARTRELLILMHLFDRIPRSFHNEPAQVPRCNAHGAQDHCLSAGGGLPRANEE